MFGLRSCWWPAACLSGVAHVGAYWAVGQIEQEISEVRLPYPPIEIFAIEQVQTVGPEAESEAPPPALPAAPAPLEPEPPPERKPPKVRRRANPLKIEPKPQVEPEPTSNTEPTVADIQAWPAQRTAPVRVATRPGPKPLGTRTGRRLPAGRPPVTVPGSGTQKRVGENPVLWTDLERALQRHYPNEARERNLDGLARLQLVVTVQGRVEQIQVLSVQGHPGFAAACQRALERSRWRPARDAGGKRIAMQIRYTCRFNVGPR